MTKKEAIARIRDHKIVHKMSEPRAIYISQALDMAIQALERVSCDDCISRQAVRELFQEGDMIGAYIFLGIDDLPSVNPQEPKTGHCDDCISRQAVHEMLENAPINPNDKWFNWLQKACLRLADLPSVKQEPKTGHWVEGKYKDTCDKCRCTYPKNIGFKNYCPNCGAKMESEEK